ncbi:hypothetical protein GOODEAATRI_012393, partial [Goodea atripinnis]
AGNLTVDAEAGRAYSLAHKMQDGCHMQRFCLQAVFTDKAIHPAIIHQGSSKSSLHGTVEPFTKANDLRVVGGGTMEINPKALCNRSPQLRRKLRAPVGGQVQGHTKTRHPGGDKRLSDIS